MRNRIDTYSEIIWDHRMELSRWIFKYIPVRSNHHPLFKYQNP